MRRKKKSLSGVFAPERLFGQRSREVIAKLAGLRCRGLRARNGLGDFAAADARRASTKSLAHALNLGLHRTKIDVPTPLGDVVGVADVVSKLRPFAADIAYSCHDLCSRTYFLLQPKSFSGKLAAGGMRT